LEKADVFSSDFAHCFSQQIFSDFNIITQNFFVSMVSSIDLVIATPPRCRDPLQTIAGDCLGGTVAHWQTVYGRVVVQLKRLHLESAQIAAAWPDNWLAYFTDSYYEYFGRHGNFWRQFDAVIVQLRERIQTIIKEDGHDLDTAQGIEQWRKLMMPFVVDLQCFSCGSMYQKRVTIFSHDPEAPERECSPCIETNDADHDQMLADYLDTLSPRSQEIEGGSEQGRRHRLKRRRRIPELCESRCRQRIS
jgi:hypothetical protein